MKNSTDIINQQNKRYHELKALGYDKSSFNAGFFEGYGFASTNNSETDFKARLVIEYKELKNRTNKLIEFLLKYDNSNKMTKQEWNLLTIQRDIMISYVSVLEYRLIELNMQDCLEWINENN